MQAQPLSRTYMTQILAVQSQCIYLRAYLTSFTRKKLQDPSDIQSFQIHHYYLFQLACKLNRNANSSIWGLARMGDDISPVPRCTSMFGLEI